MAFSSAQVTVTAAPTKIVGYDSEHSQLRSVVIRNNSTTESIDLGGSTVETAKGFTLAKEASTPPLTMSSNSVVYGVAAAGKSISVSVLIF
jgi:hypothetical protein